MTRFEHTYKNSAWNSHKKYDFLQYKNFQKIFWKAREASVTQLPGGSSYDTGVVLSVKPDCYVFESQDVQE